MRDWIRLKRRPGVDLPTILEDHRGQLRNVSGDGATTTDTLYFARNDAGTDEWVEVAMAEDVTAEIATHAALTAAHGATGAVVGTTNTQTLTNKTATDLILANTLEASGTNPTIATGAALGGAGATAVVAFGNDICGRIDLTAGTAPTTGVLCTVTFAAARPDTNFSVILTPLTASAAALNWYSGARATTTFTLDTTVTALSAGNTPSWSYLIVEDA